MLIDEIALADLFPGFEPAEINSIITCGEFLRFKRGEYLVYSTEPLTKVFLVINGEVKVFRMNPDGREQTLGRLHRGDWINLVPLLCGSSANQATAQANASTLVVSFSMHAFSELLDSYPKLSRLVASGLAHRLRMVTQRIEDISLYPVRARLARYLIRQADFNQSSQRVTQGEIAREIGSVRDVVGRLFLEFEKEGYLTKHRHEIILLDREALEKEAQISH